MTDIFLSYAREDQARIAPLAAALSAAGFDVWWDKRIAGGAEFSRETEEQLNRARIIVVAWSMAASQSMWVADEATVGRDKGNLIPIALDAAEPRIGFRQLQTIDFTGWRGGASDAPAAALIEAVRTRLGAAGPPPAPVAAPPPAPVNRQRRYAAVAAAVLGLLAAGAFVATRSPGAPGATPTEQSAASVAEPAEDTSLSVLEALAADLESKGDFRAAASAYSRFAARALLIDRARGLAARQKAYDLDPASAEALQGLIFDTALYKGPLEALNIGGAIAERGDITPQMRSFAHANLGVIELDALADSAAAEGRLAKIRQLGAGSNDPHFDYAELWLGAVIDLRLGRFDSARDKAERAEAFYLALPPETPRNGEVHTVVARYWSGDWTGALDIGAKAIERRRRAGEFLASPILDAVCRAALYLRRVGDDGGACAAVSGKGERASNAQGKIFAAMIDVDRGDFTSARSELAAAKAMATPIPPIGNSPPALPKYNPLTQVMLVDAFIAARSGEFGTARRVIHNDMAPLSENTVVRKSEQRARATASRILAESMLQAGAGEAACAEAARAAEYHRQMNAQAGVDAIKAMARAAGC